MAHGSRFSSNSDKTVINRLYVTSLLAISIIGVAWLETAFEALAKDVGNSVKQVFATKLPNVPGKSLSAVLVSYPPDGKSGPHRHSGSVFAYVVSGQIRSNSATGPSRVYLAAESFFEPPRSEHLVSENASAEESASLLAIFIADDGAQLATKGN
jgi:quercetin dioxygenase-like cupin family protein